MRVAEVEAYEGVGRVSDGFVTAVEMCGKVGRGGA